MNCHGQEVRGDVLDGETRCAHYHSEKDIVAIKFACCGVYYPCYKCHETHADHPIEVWRREQFDAKALLCGHCGTEITIRQYLEGKPCCPVCRADFNPGCHLHRHLYFEN